MARRKKAEPRLAAQVHLADTNILLRFLIGDDPPKAARTVALMERVERADEILEIPDEVVTETVWTLESYYRVPRAERDGFQKTWRCVGDALSVGVHYA